uniref:Uncharacterized protein n=1 Tax=Cacopsylla melanoneura TaxID=428564 RepID=A0A8D9AAG5_9HEMI
MGIMMTLHMMMIVLPEEDEMVPGTNFAETNPRPIRTATFVVAVEVQPITIGGEGTIDEEEGVEGEEEEMHGEEGEEEEGKEEEEGEKGKGNEEGEEEGEEEEKEGEKGEEE